MIILALRRQASTPLALLEKSPVKLLLRTIRLVNAGAKLIGTNYDLTGPTETGIAPACRGKG